jgi:DNA-nicking Smr family endonuclease
VLGGYSLRGSKLLGGPDRHPEVQKDTARSPLVRLKKAKRPLLRHPEHPPDGPPQVDLHRLKVQEALRRLQRELHACRVRGAPRLLVITGSGHGNRRQEPVLRSAVEAWLAGPEARGLGVRSHRRAHRGGALEVSLARPP